MKTKLPIGKSARIEPYLSEFSYKIKDLVSFDTLAISTKAKSVVVDTSFIPDLGMIKAQRNSNYKLIGLIDPEGKSFNLNKVHKLHNLLDADGFDIGLSKDRNKKDLHNEIVGIKRFLSMSGLRYEIRWIINVGFGHNHIDNCIDAIKSTRSEKDIICISTKGIDLDAKTIFNLIKNCRQRLGKPKSLIKLHADFNEELITDKDLNITYQFNAEELL